MKKATVFGAAVILVAVSACGQGYILFRTHPRPIDDRVRNLDGSLVTSSQGYRAELIYAPYGTPHDQFGIVAVRLGNDAAVGIPVPGVISAGSRTAPITRDTDGSPAPGGIALFQVRVWRLADGPTFDAALFLGDPGIFSRLAVSPIMCADTGNHLAIPPELPSELPLPSSVGGGGLTLGNYYWDPSSPCIPEPSVIGLGLLAVGALLMRHWRK